MNYFITGVSSGIGRELVRQLIASGHIIYGVARRQDLLGSLSQELNSDRFIFNVCDVSKPEQINEIVNHLKKINYVPDVAIFNAAIYEEDALPVFDNQAYKRIMQINLKGVVDWLEPLLDLSQQKPTKFIVISSTAAFRPIYGGVGYSVSKAAAAMVFRGLNVVYAKKNKLFKIAYLGPVATDISPTYKKAVQEKSLIRFFIPTPDYIASKVIRFAENKKQRVYLPFISTLVFRILRVLPDTWFSYISLKLKRRN